MHDEKYQNFRKLKTNKPFEIHFLFTVVSWLLVPLVALETRPPGAMTDKNTPKVAVVAVVRVFSVFVLPRF